MLTGKPCITSEEIEVRKKRILKADYSDHPNQTPVLHNETSESLRQKHSEKMRKFGIFSQKIRKCPSFFVFFVEKNSKRR